MLALLVFALVPFATEELHLAEDPPTAPDDLDDAMPLVGAVNGLSGAESEAGSRVLVAVEYGPSAARELDPLLEAVLYDILAHGGTPVITGTNPLGLLHASHMLESLVADEALAGAIQENNPPYVVLPYLPGGAVGVRSLTTSETFTGTIFTHDFYGEDTNLGIEELGADDFAFIVVAGERLEDARIWAEQTSDLNMQKFLLVSAAAEPITRPYVSTDGYIGMLSGIQGAYMYNAASGQGRLTSFDPPENLDIPNPALSRWHSAALGAIAAAVIIGVGALFNIARMIRRRREQHS